jgi:hypothetical protein
MDGLRPPLRVSSSRIEGLRPPLRMTGPGTARVMTSDSIGSPTSESTVPRIDGRRRGAAAAAQMTAYVIKSIGSYVS